MKKPSALKRLIQGKTKLGQVIYGIVDILPFPNVLNLVRASIDQEPNAGAGRIAQITWGKIDKFRLAVSLIALYLVASGQLEIEKARELADLVLSIMGAK
jgi:hypothetical protein